MLFLYIFSETMSFNSPISRHICVSIYKEGHFFTLIIHELSLCVGKSITPVKWAIVKSFV